MPRGNALGPLDPIFNVKTKYGAIIAGNTPGVSPISFVGQGTLLQSSGAGPFSIDLPDDIEAGDLLISSAIAFSSMAFTATPEDDGWDVQYEAVNPPYGAGFYLFGIWTTIATGSDVAPTFDTNFTQAVQARAYAFRSVTDTVTDSVTKSISGSDGSPNIGLNLGPVDTTALSTLAFMVIGTDASLSAGTGTDFTELHNSFYDLGVNGSCSLAAQYWIADTTGAVAVPNYTIPVLPNLRSGGCFVFTT